MILTDTPTASPTNTPADTPTNTPPTPPTNTPEPPPTKTPGPPSTPQDTPPAGPTDTPALEEVLTLPITGQGALIPLLVLLAVGVGLLGLARLRHSHLR
jgi:hypothetical protein